MLKTVLLTVTSGLFLSIPAFAQNTVEVAFCGESLPEHIPAVKQRWFRILNRQAAHPSHLATLKRRASVVFPVIDPIIARYGIPRDFRFLPLLESAAMNNAISRKGAAGFWQIMPETGRLLGLRVSKGYDERYDLLKATHAACRYIKDLHKQLGSWMLVAAAYNAGPSYIQTLRRRYPDQHPMAMPYRAAETQAYVYQALAIKELLTRPADYRHYFSDRTVAELSNDHIAVSSQDRDAILASYQTERAESMAAVVVDDMHPEEREAIQEEVMLITDVELEEEVVAGAPTAPLEITPATPLIMTRRLGADALTEGQLVLFEVVQPSEINGVKVSVGDMLYAHVDMIEPTSGRAFLHTERLVTAQTQATTNLRLVAVEKTKQPGVKVPPSYEMASNGWRLTWEQL
ncbi:MAG: lytic transglycosylase domain-containing protein [Cytophagales bacterium]|nr:MAG: lytic transglycosylase domain-containing protein [Cytophagales bacterium]